MPLLDDAGFVNEEENAEDIWEGAADDDSELDECNFLGFRSTKSGLMDVSGAEDRNGLSQSAANRTKRPKKSATKNESTTNGCSAPKDECALNSELDDEEDRAEDRPTSPYKLRKRKSNELEKSPAKERPGSKDGWESCLRQRTQVFHYYQINERRRKPTLTMNADDEDELKQSPSEVKSETKSPEKVLANGSQIAESKSKKSPIVNGKSANIGKDNKMEVVVLEKLPCIESPRNKESPENRVAESTPQQKRKNNDLPQNGEDLSDNDIPIELKTPTNSASHEMVVTPKSRPIRRSKKKLKRLLIAERSNTPDGIWLSVSRSPSPACMETYEPSDTANGVIVWAKLAKYPWWPAIIMNGEDCGRDPAPDGAQWIFWLGDHKISKLLTSQMVEFVTNFKNKYNERGSKQYFRSVTEALTICAGRCGAKISADDPQALMKWAKDGFQNNSYKEFPFVPNPLDPIPEFIRRRQEKIRATSLLDRSLHDNTNGSPLLLSGRDCIPSAIAKVKAGQLKITEMCLACDSVDAQVVAMHPLFEGGVCKDCKEELRETLYAIGEDGTSSYCAVCGSPGQLIICDHPGCSKVYCSSCIKLYAADGQLDVVVQASPWHCFFCLEFDPKVHGYLRKSDNWELNSIQLFQIDSQVHLFPEKCFTNKRPIRVLSLFDGIGTGRLVLDRLNIEVEVYYSSEIDSDSMLVASVRHKVTHLGNVEDLRDSDIAKLCPFDLLIGGSPCNDLSLVNPIRKGLYDPTGTGKLFFDYFRILKAIQLNNKNTHLFWLFENVASMPHEFRGIINRFLQCEPSLIDSKYFSPQNRARYYWGNIPGLYSSIPSHYVEQEIPLQSIITPDCNRKAMVDKVRCITTRSNSLVQKGGAYPVEMDGKPDHLWINELERAFGFPEHHTDIGNLSFNRRQHLLGRAWTVPVVEYILKPLRNFFKLISEESVSQTTA